MPRTAKKVASSASKTVAKSATKKQISKPKSSTNKVKVSIKKPVSTAVKRVEKGKMSIDTEQMLKDLVELGRIDESQKQEKPKKTYSNKKYNAFTDLSRSPLNNYIKDKTSGWILKFSLAFFMIVLFVFLFIIYVINTKSTINLVLKDSTATSQVQRTFNIYDVNDLALANPNNNVIVVNSPVKVEVSESFPVSTQTVRAEKAEGKIKVINESSAPYTLVATTRFLSDTTGDLYRLKEAVVIPAGSSVDAEIYADSASFEGEAKDTRFTIIGFSSEETRRLVYGKSIEKIDHTTSAKAIVSEEDIQKAKTSVETKMRQEAMNNLQLSMSKYSNFVMLSDSFKFDVTKVLLNGVKAGDEVSEIKIDASASAAALFVDKNRILDIMKTNILSQASSSKTVKINEDTLSFYVTKTDLTNRIATLSLSVDSRSSYNVDQLLDRKAIVGMKISDLYDYIEDKGFADSVQVISKPFWNKRLPKIIDNIIINVK